MNQTDKNTVDNKYVYVISVISETEPVVTVFDNETAAKKYYEWAKNNNPTNSLVILDKAPLYKNFIVTV